MERATNARQRTLDNLLWDIIQTLLRRSAVESVRQLTDWLQYDFPKYERRNKHTLRKDVAKAIARAAHYRRLKLAREDAIHGTPFDDVVAAAQARALEADQIKTTFKHLRELLVQDGQCIVGPTCRIVGPAPSSSLFTLISRGPN